MKRKIRRLIEVADGLITQEVLPSAPVFAIWKDSTAHLLAVDNRNLKDDALQNFYAWGLGPIAYSSEDGTQLSTGTTHNLREVTPRFANPAALDYTQSAKRAGRDKGETLDWMTAGATDISGSSSSPRAV